MCASPTRTARRCCAISTWSSSRASASGWSGRPFQHADKSTALALLQRFYDIQGGGILVDGQDIRAVTQESLRQAMAIVPQDISLFHRSVLENIRYARPEATEQEVLRAAEMAHCRDFIEAMPDGLPPSSAIARGKAVGRPAAAFWRCRARAAEGRTDPAAG